MEIVAETYRPDVAEKIAALGAKITDEMLVDQSHDVHKKQADYVAAAVRLGLMLEAKFAAICKANRVSNSPNHRMDTRVHSIESESFPEFCRRVFGENTERNMRRYRWLGRRYLQAATETLQAQSSELAKSLQHADSIDAEALMLDNAGGKHGGLSLRNWIAGRSLRQLILDLRQADAEAQKEEVEEERRAFAQAQQCTANDALAEGAPEPDTPEALENDQKWRQMNLPGFVKLAKQDTQLVFDKLEEASGAQEAVDGLPQRACREGESGGGKTVYFGGRRNLSMGLIAKYAVVYEGWEFGWQIRVLKGRMRREISLEGMVAHPGIDKAGEILFSDIRVAEAFCVKMDAAFEETLEAAREFKPEDKN